MNTPSPKDEQIKVLDFESALKNLAGNEAVLREMIQSLVDDLPTKSEEATLLLQKQDWENLEMLTHQLCGAANLCKMEKLNGIARKITTSLRKKEFSDIDRQIPELQSTIAELLRLVEEKLNIKKTATLNKPL